MSGSQRVDEVTGSKSQLRLSGSCDPRWTFVDVLKILPVNSSIGVQRPQTLSQFLAIQTEKYGGPAAAAETMEKINVIRCRRCLPCAKVCEVPK